LHTRRDEQIKKLAKTTEAPRSMLPEDRIGCSTISVYCDKVARSLIKTLQSKTSKLICKALLQSDPL
jgi:hypothetical protein